MGQTGVGEEKGHLFNRLVGIANNSTVLLNGTSFEALIDSGSMVSTISESSAKSLKSESFPLQDFGLSLSIADGSK